MMQNAEQNERNDLDREVKKVELEQGSQTFVQSSTSDENVTLETPQSNFTQEISCSDDEEVSEVDSFSLDQDLDERDQVLEPGFLLTRETIEGANLQTVTVDPETHARLEALLEAAGIGKLSTADGKALTDPDVLRKLTSSVSCALDEAAQALHRMRAEQQGQLGSMDSSRSLAEACSDGDVPTVRKLLREGGSVHETTEEGDSLLSLACSAGYYELAQVLLAMKANVEDRGIKGDCTPLMEAASGGYVDIVRLLINHGADVNAQSSAGNTPLHYAACGGYEDVVQVLIDSGANVEQHNENGHTPLMEAASAGHVSVARLLLQAGAGINTHSNEFKESALTLACYKGHLEMVKFLLEAGADQEHKTDEMHTALMEASMDGHVEVARLLLDSGAQVNMPADSFESPLTLAACGGHVELANLLIERGANLEEVNDEGYTPLMEAAREGHEEMVALLLAHGADINAQTEETQETALTLACCGGFLDVADFLIKAGADIELGCSTPLMEAAQEGHLELVKYLLKVHANVHAQTGTGDTALTYACENGHTDVAEVLLEHGAELEHESEGGRTPLMKAARAGHQCTVQFLISKGADVNRQTSTNDHTVLSLACAGGHLSVVELLLAHGADPTHKLKDGSTMVIEAAKGGHTQVVKLLLEYPNRMLMSPLPDVPQLSQADSHLVEARVPVHGLAHIVPPSEPDSHVKPNNLTTSSVCDQAATPGVKRKTMEKEFNISTKTTDQIWQNMQKSSTKRTVSSGNANCGSDSSNKGSRTSSFTSTGSDLMCGENGLHDLISDEAVDLKAGERLEAIISNVMAKELINTTSTREEQILRKQQILEELQKVERELQEKAQAQLLLSAQHHLEQQQQQQLQQVLQVQGNKPLHKVLHKQLDEQVKRKRESTYSDVISSPVVSSSSLDLIAADTLQMSNNLDKQGTRTSTGEQQSNGMVKPNICAGVSSGPANPFGASINDLQNQGDEVPEANKGNSGSKTGTKRKNTKNDGNFLKTNGGHLSVNGGFLSSEQYNGGSQSQQPAPSPTLPLQLSLQQHVPPPPPPLQSLTQQQLQIQHQFQQLQQQHQFQQQQQQTVINPPLILNESHRQHLQNLILRQQQEVQQQQQLTQQPSTLQFPQLQLTPQQQDQLLQMLSQQALPQAFGQQQVPSQQPLQQQQPQTLQQMLPQVPISSQVLTQQQQQQFLQQQQQAQYLQQQLQQIKSPANMQKQMTNKKHLLNNQLGNQDSGLGIETVTPPSSTPMTPNPSPVSPQTISPLYAPIDLDAQTESNHDTALTLACAGGHAELVQLLLSKNADIEHRDKKGFTPLILAATAGHVDVVEILLEHTADIEAQSERTKDTPLSLACSGGRYEVVELLLSRSANKEHRNVSDYTPLSLAASGGYVNIIKLLLSHGAEINSRTGSKLGISPLMLAAMNGHTAAVKLLLDMGSDINAQIETNRNTALTLACFQGRHEVVSLLVDRKANIEHRAKTGLTPLMEAASGGYVEVGRVLLDKGADVNAPPVPSSRDTALTIAADKGHYRFVELLLQRCAAVDVKNKKGNSPLWLACNGGHLDVVQLLVNYKADIDSQDNRKVSCLMASFRKGHVKVVKWMVKHVTQFPSDQDLSRYIATVADKELQKKCQQCMEIIVSAKDRQAAEANKNATILLEELDKERQQEESRRAAAAKKRERKKKKKKEKQQEQGGDKETSKTSSPEPESEDSNSKEEAKENMTCMNIEETEHRVPLAPPTATTTSTLGLTLPTISEAKYSKPSKNRSSKSNKDEQNAITMESKMTRPNRKEREKSRPQDIKSDHLGLGMRSTSTPTSVTASSVSTVVMTVASNDDPGNKGTSYLKGRTEVLGPASSGNAKKKKDDLKPLGSTGIGDLDDFGSLPEISERDIEKLRKSVEKTKISYGNSGSTLQSSPQAGEKTILISDMNPNMLSVKSSALITNSPKRGQKKEEDWKEVIRRSKKVQVPASAISRVIGRGGCNINAIREVSGAHIEVEKNRGSGERVITIKGSADATRQAHALISALVQDPDKDLQELLPKNKSSSSSSSSTSSSSSKSDKSLYFIPPPEVYPLGNSPSSQQLGSQSKSTINNKSVGPRLQQVFSGVAPGSNGRTSQNQVWGNSSSGLISPRRAKQQNSLGNFTSPATLGSSNDKSVSRQLFLNEKKSFTGLVQTSTNATVTYSQTSTGTRTSPSSSPVAAGRSDLRQPTPNRGGKQLIPGTVRVLQRPSTVCLKYEPQPLPIVSNQSTTVTSTIASTIGLQPGGSIPASVPGDFSPFDNLLSNVAEHFLGKKEESERMNFASVAAAGVVSNLSGSTPVSSTPPPTNHIDPALQAKAPGFKLPGPRMTGSLDQEFHIPPRMPGAFNPSYQMPPPAMMNNFEMLRMPGVYQPTQHPMMFQSSHSNSSTPPSHSPRGGPGAEGRGQVSSADQIQLSSSMSSVSSLKDEYTTPNQPMTLPKISSTLNPNAPDFTSRSSTTMMSGGPPGPSFGPGQGGPINMPTMENFTAMPPANIQALYQQAFTQQLISAFSNIGPTNNFGPSLNPGPGPSPSPGSVGSHDGIRSSIIHQELYQNVANLMHQIAMQNGGMGLGGPNPVTAQGFVPPHSITRPYSPLTAQGRPSSAPSIGILAKDGSSPSLGHPSSGSPLPPSTPPLDSLMRGGEVDRRQLRPIGGERAAQRKAPGPAISIGSGHSSMEELGPPFWNLSSDFNMEWTPKSSIGLSVSNVPQSSVPVVMSSVISGGSMMSAAGDGRQVGMDNHSSSHFEDGLGEQSFGPNVQVPPHQQMPLFNSVGQFSMGDQGQSYQTGTIGAGEGPADMWNHMDSTPVSDIQDKGVSEPKKMWNSWNSK